MADKEFSHEQAKRPVPAGTPHTSSTFNHFIPSYLPLIHLVWLAPIGLSRVGAMVTPLIQCFPSATFFFFLSWNNRGYMFDQHL